MGMSMSRKLSFAVGLAGMMAGLAAGSALASSGEGAPNLSKAWEKAYNAGDAAGVAALYTDDGVMMPPGAKATQGRSAIAAFIEKEVSGTQGTSLAIEVAEQAESGNIGFARGTYTVTAADGSTLDTGKWVEVRKKVSGKWYIHRDIWNSDRTPGAGSE